MGHYRTETLIPRNNVDIMLKVITEQFADKALRFYGVDASNVKSIEPTELAEFVVSEKRMDCVFLLEDDSYLHLEFQTSYRQKDLERFLQYDVSLYRKKKKRIKTVVVYASGVTQSDEVLDIGSVNYRVHAFYLSRLDGDKQYRELCQKISRDETLTEEDQLNLIFLPLMPTEKEQSERTQEALRLASLISDDEQRTLLVSCIRGLSARFLNHQFVYELKEGIPMSNDLAELFFQVGAIEHVRHQILTYLQETFGQPPAELEQKVRGIDEVNRLDRLLFAVVKTNSLQEAEQVVEESLRAH